MTEFVQEAVVEVSSPTKTRAQTAKVVKKKTVTTTKVTVQGQISKAYESRGLTEEAVELEHLRTLVQEMQREREVTESLQRDNAMLREQLGRADERIDGLEKVRHEQSEQIS